MKKAIAVIMSIIILMCTTLPVAAIKSVPVQGIKLDTSKITLKTGESQTLKIAFTPAKTTQTRLVFTTDNKNVATVDASGKITGVKAGTTTITVASYYKKSITAKCTVTVPAPVAVATPAPKVVAPAYMNAEGYPIAKKKTPLKVLVQQSTFVQDYSTNEFTKAYEEKTNVQVEWNVVAGSGDQVTQKVSMILASGSDYPDVIMSSLLSKPQVVIYGTQGVLLPLNDLINKYSVHLKKALSEDEYFRKTSTYLDGKIYFFPSLKYTYHTSMPNKMWVYQPWLDKLGLKAPKTTDEFYNMLKAFKEKDPNGNKKADELPMIAMGVKSYNGMTRFLMSAFTIPEGYYLEKNKVVYAPANPEYKDGLKYIKKLYDEGLISKDSITIDRKQATALAENPDVPIVGAEPSLWYGMFTNNGAASGRYKEFNAISPLKGPKGVQMTQLLRDPVNVAAVITKSCKYPEMATRWIDWFYSMEGDLTSSWGPEGVGWRKAGRGENGIDEDPALYAILGNQKFGQNQNKTWANPIIAYESNKFRMGISTLDPNDTEPRLYRETKLKYEPYATKADKELPWLWMSEEESQEYAQLDVLINKAWEEGLAKVIASSKDVDKDWDAVIANINSLGLKRAIELRQTAYDAYLKSIK